MDSNIPHHLCLALFALISAREDIASIDAIEDARLCDMILTKFSPAIYSVVRPRQSKTPVDDSSDSVFNC